MKSALSTLVLLTVLAPTAAFAQPVDEELPPGMAPDDDERDFLLGGEAEPPSMPSRIFLSVGAGSSVRLIKDLDFSQQRVAPAFIDLFGAFVLPGAAESLRHGLGVNVSMNLTGDGPIDELGVDGGAQLSLGPYYLAYLRLGWDFMVGGKLGVPISVTPATAPGLELAVSLTWYLTAGFGFYVEAGGSAWLGSASSLHPILSYDVGVVIDYEVLP